MTSEELVVPTEEEGVGRAAVRVTEPETTVVGGCGSPAEGYWGVSTESE